MVNYFTLPDNARLPVRVSPPILLAMLTPKQPRLDTGIQQSPPVQVRIARNQSCNQLEGKQRRLSLCRNPELPQAAWA